MNIAIIDDEEDARYLLRTALQKEYNEKINLIVEAVSVKSGKELLKRQKVDILFLDIKLQDGTGFDILDQVTLDQTKIVFVTAFDEFALKAFDFYAFAYLVKPFKQSQLNEVVSRILNGITKQTKNQVAMISNAYRSNPLEKIIVPDVDGFQVILIENLLYLKSDNNYTEFFLQDGSKIHSSKTLKAYERLLEKSGFFRIHRSYLINISKVKSYSSLDGSHVKFENDIEIPIGRRKLAQFRSIFLGK